MSTVVAAPCDRGIVESATARPCTHRGYTLLASILASSLAFIDGSVVNVSLPTIGRELGAGAADLQWILNAYLLPVSALLLLGGAAGDAYGRRRVFLAGIVIFAAASLACAAAPSLATLLAGRALQGLGAAMLMPNSLSLLGSAFEGEARGRAIGIWAAVGAAAGAIGPLVGGWLVGAVGWRAIFLVNLPVAAGALWLGLAYVRESTGEEGARLDWLGGGLATLGLGALTWALTVLTGTAGWRPAAIAAAVLGAVAFAAFIMVERRRGDRAMMPLAIFATPTSAGLTLLTFLLYAALSGLLVLLPYLLIEGQSYSPVAAGAALLPLPAALGIASPAMGALAARVGPRLPLSVGPVIVAAGLALGSRIDGTGSYVATVLPPMLLVALGMAVAVAPLTTVVMGSVDAVHVGAANGFNSAVARTGGLAATASLGGVLAARGEDLVAAFQAAAWVGVAATLAAGLSAVLLLGRDAPRAR